MVTNWEFLRRPYKKCKRVDASKRKNGCIINLMRTCSRRGTT